MGKKGVEAVTLTAMKDGKPDRKVTLTADEFKAQMHEPTGATREVLAEAVGQVLAPGGTAPTKGPTICPSDVVELAERIREEHHGQLELARIAYLFVPRAPRSGGKARLGHAQKASPTLKLLSGYDFVITLSKDVWDEWSVKGLADKQEALIDHELCHCWFSEDEDGNWTGWEIRHHDAEEFIEIIERRGLWLGSLEAVGRMVRQLKLGE